MRGFADSSADLCALGCGIKGGGGTNMGTSLDTRYNRRGHSGLRGARALPSCLRHFSVHTNLGVGMTEGLHLLQSPCVSRCGGQMGCERPEDEGRRALGSRSSTVPVASGACYYAPLCCVSEHLEPRAGRMDQRQKSVGSFDVPSS